MNIEQYRDFCLAKKGVTESFPFDQDVLVFKVLGKIFALTSLKDWEEGIQFINLKCDPEYAIELRTTYESIDPGYHMSKKHWNSVRIYKGELPYELISQLITQSYDLVVNSLTKKQREVLSH
ncbi:MAG: MmcQ/YjbR family DNA-binding protein [Flavobacteriaceae bacterium]|nr:MmcQ/YjbR family DNA-binding protein [Flavobacteriaceae bacterium]